MTQQLFITKSQVNFIILSKYFINGLRPEFPIGYEIIYWGQTPVDSIPIWLNTDNTYKLIIKNPETG